MSLEEMMESSERNSKTFTRHVPSYFLPLELFKILSIVPESPVQMDYKFHQPYDSFLCFKDV
jgi:hypothetical protein